jgi:flagellar motor switch protein FliG
MAFTGKQKAAVLLMNMDPGIAAELLKGIDPEVIQEIAVELARMDASGGSDRKTGAKIAQEFYSSLQKGETANLSIRSFLNDTLSSILDKDLAQRIQSQVKEVAETKDLFAGIRSASTDELVLALEGEHPQTIAVVLSELNVKKSQEVLGLLGEEVCVRTVCRLTNPEPLGARVRERIASMITKRLGSFKGETVSKKPDQHLRKRKIFQR